MISTIPSAWPSGVEQYARAHAHVLKISVFRLELEL